MSSGDNFVNILDPDQAQRFNVGPDLDPNCLMVFLKEFIRKKLFLKKKSGDEEKAYKISQWAD